MTVTDEIKLFGRKTMENEGQYELGRKAAKISELSSNNLDKYEYLTGEDLGLKPSSIEQTKFEYYPSSKIFDKELDKDDQKEGLFKRLKSIEGKNEKQSKVLKDQLEKQPIISKVKNPNFSNASCSNLLDDSSMEVFNKTKDEDQILIFPLI